MKYRIHFQPMDIEADSPEKASKKLFNNLFPDNCKGWRTGRLELIPVISKILPVDKDGFIIEQPKAYAPM